MHATDDTTDEIKLDFSQPFTACIGVCRKCQCVYPVVVRTGATNGKHVAEVASPDGSRCNHDFEAHSIATADSVEEATTAAVTFMQETAMGVPQAQRGPIRFTPILNVGPPRLSLVKP